MLGDDRIDCIGSITFKRNGIRECSCGHARSAHVREDEFYNACVYCKCPYFEEEDRE